MIYEDFEVSELRAIFGYDEQSGFVYKIDNGILKRAGWNSDRYRRIEHKSHKWQEHRVVWALVHGEWPNGVIDHIDGNGFNNRVENLRAVSLQENFRNRKVSKNNTTGYPGVVLLPSGSYRVTIGAGGRRKHLGCFESLSEAVQARKVAEQKLGYTTRGAAL